MRSQEATTVVSAPIAAVMTRLRAVEEWPAFLSAVTTATRTGHLRYIFEVVDGRSRREVPIVLHVDVRKHAIRWKSAHGPAFGGCLSLTEADPGRTRVRLELTQHPGTFGSMAAEMFSPNTSRALLDIERLDHFLTGTRSAR